MKPCKFVSHLATFWHRYKGEEGASAAKIKLCLNNYDSPSHVQCQCLLSLAASSCGSSRERSRRPIRIKNKQNNAIQDAPLYLDPEKKILADFDKLISEQTRNTRLRCLIIVNVAYLQLQKAGCICCVSPSLMPQHMAFFIGRSRGTAESSGIKKKSDQKYLFHKRTQAVCSQSTDLCGFKRCLCLLIDVYFHVFIKI